MMRIVEDDYTRFRWLIGPWVGTADNDADAERLESVNVKDEEAVKDLIENDLIPWFKGSSATRKGDALEGLRYGLNAPAHEVERMFDAALVALVYDADDAKRIVSLIGDVFQAHQIHLP